MPPKKFENSTQLSKTTDFMDVWHTLGWLRMCSIVCVCVCCFGLGRNFSVCYFQTSTKWMRCGGIGVFIGFPFKSAMFLRARRIIFTTAEIAQVQRQPTLRIWRNSFASIHVDDVLHESCNFPKPTTFVNRNCVWLFCDWMHIPVTKSNRRRFSGEKRS